MGKIVEKKKKKKGRPSLLDLQKRNLKEQQEEQKRQQQLQQKRRSQNNSAPHSRDNYRTATPVRRSARRNPNTGEDSPERPEDDEDEDEDDELAGKRREKKLKLVLRVPPNQQSPPNSPSRNSGGSDSDAGEDDAGGGGNKKRKINAIADGSGRKGDKSISGADQSNSFQGATKLDSGPSTPLPDKKLLLFVLERLQKKDTYGVFSDPVDPEELPDYHDVISHPMDFGTVRKKLTGGAYASLEQFEKDVFLICSNAMQYNSPDTVYFRQARSIHELAKKNFENLRQDSDDNEPETKIVRRGRPPTKNLKKPIGRPSLEGAGSEFSDGTPATGGDSATLLPNHDTRKGSLLLDKSCLAESSGRMNALRTNDLYASWLADNKFERNDEFTGSMMRGTKHVKKQVVHEESRRNTYMQSHPSAGVREPSVLMTFDGERKQLMPVGVLVEHGYARSLARFAANLGPLAWKIAAKKIERSLPAAVKFGPGWVGENDLPQRKMPLLLPQISGLPLASRTLPDLAIPSHIENRSTNSKVDKLYEKPGGYSSDKHAPSSSTSTSDSHPSKSLPVSATTSSVPVFANKSPEPIRPKADTFEGPKPHDGFNMRNNSISRTKPRPHFPTHQGPMIHPGMNGFNGFNLAAQMGKLAGSARPAGLNTPSSQMLVTSSRTKTNTVHPPTTNSLVSDDTNKALENRSPINPVSALPNQGNEPPVPPPPGFHPRPSWQSLSPQPRPDSVPPDLNIRFQSPGSPSSSRVDSTQPDLALQL